MAILSGFLITGLLPGTVIAADQNQLEELTITIGSRVVGRTVEEATAPVDIIEYGALAKNGFTSLGESLQSSAPSFNFSRTQVSDGSDIFRPATLRGLQPDQTLVLINGKRRHNQSIFALAGTVGEGAAGTDMNAIPMIALQRVEVLRDGAAAQYGSDAIAGVINLQLKEMTGETSGFLQWGETGEGDGGTLTAGVNTGFDIGADGGFINLSVEYRDADATNRAQPDTGGPDAISSSVRWHQGDAETEFESVFYNAMLPVGNNGELYSFGGYSNRTALGSGFYRDYNRAERNVPQVYPTGFLPHIDNEAEDTSIAFGYRHELNDIWAMDASVVYGENTYDFDSRGSINSSIAAEYLFNNPAATDADIAANSGPTSAYSGGFEFDQTTFNLDFTGSVNLFGNDPLYVAVGGEYRDESYQINPGTLESYSCGTTDTGIGVGGAVGVFPSVIDGVTIANCGMQAYPGLRPEAATSADRDSLAVYLDLEQNITEAWLVGAAMRYEDYDVAGSETTGKLSSRFEFTDSFAIRGAVATGFRAPSLQQSAYTAFTTTLGGDGTLTQSFTAAAGSDLPSSLGVSNLEIETSESIGFGFVWSPIDSITATLDYYKVKIDDRITLGGFLSAADVAFNPEAAAALAATGADQANFFSNAIDTTTDGIDLIITYDTELAEGDLSVILAGNINDSNVDQIHAPEGISDDIAFSPLSAAFIEGGQPGERATLTFDWARNAINAVARLNYFGETEVDYFGGNHIGIPGAPPTSIVESALLVDLYVSYDITENLTVSAGGNNIFDETPDELAPNEVLDIITNGAMKYPLRAAPYGFNGSSYYLKAAFNF
ncbi:MAG: ligand-gated channel protein [Chromatiales bacterium]|jgi:iron complex outermembrane receptor protein|nr:ligand-gated channel protein [Chromatiales bacterium]